MCTFKHHYCRISAETSVFGHGFNFFDQSRAGCWHPLCGSFHFFVVDNLNILAAFSVIFPFAVFLKTADWIFGDVVSLICFYFWGNHLFWNASAEITSSNTGLCNDNVTNSSAVPPTSDLLRPSLDASLGLIFLGALFHKITIFHIMKNKCSQLY